MNNKHKYLLIDTETANGLDDPMVYNFAGAVIDQHHNIYEMGNFINKDIFYGKKELMQTAYYAKKIPEYIQQVENGEVIPKSWYEIKAWTRAICEKYSIKAVIAHNARFDYRSCTVTQRMETCSKYRYFFPYGVEIWDTLKMAQDILSKRPSYLAWCKKYGFMVNENRPRLTAEIIYRFITNELEFSEVHKAMEDVEIECQIFWWLIDRHQKMTRKCFKDRTIPKAVKIG